jgi:hypothetical protein
MMLSIFMPSFTIKRQGGVSEEHCFQRFLNDNNYKHEK